MGCGGHGKVVADIAIKCKNYAEIFFLDDKPVFQEWQGIKVLGNSKFLDFKENDEVFVAIGNSKIREDLQKYYKNQGIKIAVLIHPQAVIGRETVVKEGTVIMAGAIVNCSTIIEEGSIINTGATVDHDNKIGKFSHISVGAHLAGTVKVGNYVWIGAGAIVKNNIEICDESVVGAGAVIVNDINKKGIYVGVPAKLKGE